MRQENGLKKRNRNEDEDKMKLRSIGYEKSFHHVLLFFFSFSFFLSSPIFPFLFISALPSTPLHSTRLLSNLLSYISLPLKHITYPHISFLFIFSCILLHLFYTHILDLISSHILSYSVIYFICSPLLSSSPPIPHILIISLFSPVDVLQ